MLLNLSNNAIKFTRREHVRINVKLADEQPFEGADVLHFEVEDSGCGIAEDKFDRLFKAFSQVDSSTTRDFGGTGLGLAISKKSSSSRWGAKSGFGELDVGSHFHFHIVLPPFEQKTEPAVAPIGESEEEDLLAPDFADHHPLRVLLCEDDKDNRWVIRELLETLRLPAGCGRE